MSGNNYHNEALGHLGAYSSSKRYKSSSASPGHVTLMSLFGYFGSQRCDASCRPRHTADHLDDRNTWITQIWQNIRITPPSSTVMEQHLQVSSHESLFYVQLPIRKTVNQGLYCPASSKKHTGNLLSMHETVLNFQLSKLSGLKRFSNVMLEQFRWRSSGRLLQEPPYKPRISLIPAFPMSSAD